MQTTVGATGIRVASRRGYPLASTAYDQAFRVAAARRVLYRNGLDSTVAGHVSVRDGDRVWITGLQYFDETVPEDVSVLNLDGSVRSAGRVPLSPAVGFHLSVYRARRDVSAVIHTHGRNVAALSTSECRLEMYNVYAPLFAGDVASFEDQDGLSAEREADAIADALGDKRALIMRYHGAIHVGESLELATADAILLEYCAGQQLDAIRIGGTPMSPAVVAAYREAYWSGLRENVWDANFRRLVVSDPDLFAGLELADAPAAPSVERTEPSMPARREVCFVSPADLEQRRNGELVSDVIRQRLPARYREDTTTAVHFPGGDDALQLIEVELAPDFHVEPHAHDVDEIIVVKLGELRFGSRRCPAGTTVYVPAETLYGFRAGADGCTFLNFRGPGEASFITRTELRRRQARRREVRQ